VAFDLLAVIHQATQMGPTCAGGRRAALAGGGVGKQPCLSGALPQRSALRRPDQV